jgi:hypothetical protein
MDELKELVKRCSTADRVEQQKNLKRYVESIIMEPEFIKSLRKKIDSRSSVALNVVIQVELDNRLLKYIEEETVLVYKETFPYLRWAPEEEFVRNLNMNLGYENVKIKSLCHSSYSTDDDSYNTIHFKCDLSYDQPSPPEPDEDVVNNKLVKRIVKRILKYSALAAFLGIPEITLEKRICHASDSYINPATLKKIEEKVDMPIVEYPKEIKVKIDPTKFDTQAVKESLDHLKQMKKKKVFKTAAKSSDRIIKMLKNDVRDLFGENAPRRARFFSTYQYICEDLWELEGQLTDDRCPELEKADPTSFEFTPEEEEKLNAMLGLKGFKMKMEKFTWVLEYPPGLLQ